MIITLNNGTLGINANGVWSVCAANGQTIARDNGNASVNLVLGLYIVKTGNKAEKIAVK